MQTLREAQVLDVVAVASVFGGAETVFLILPPVSNVGEVDISLMSPRFCHGYSHDNIEPTDLPETMLIFAGDVCHTIIVQYDLASDRRPTFHQRNFIIDAIFLLSHTWSTSYLYRRLPSEQCDSSKNATPSQPTHAVAASQKYAISDSTAKLQTLGK